MNTIRTTKTAGMFAITMLLGAPAFAEAPEDPQQSPDTLQAPSEGATEDMAEADGQPPETEDAKSTADAPKGEWKRGPKAAPSQSSLRADSLPLSSLDKAQIEGVQEKLQNAGYYEGEIDGMVGPLTRSALRGYYRDQARLASTGRLLADSATLFGLDEMEIERVKGTDAPERETLRGERAADATPRGAESMEADMKFELSETATESDAAGLQGDVRSQPSADTSVPDEQTMEPTEVESD